jgi:predicted SAM-dependent methyltransferase
MRTIRNITRTLVYIGVVFNVYELLSYLRFKGRLSDARRHGHLRLQLGSGTHDVPGWVSIDMLIRKNILAMRLPGGLRRFPDESVQYIYSSHFLEHIEYPVQASEFARQCLRILKPGGAMRIVVPGIEKIIRAYAADNEEFFRLQSEMHPEWCTTKLDHLMYALQQNGQHKYAYDLETITKLLSDAGFTKVVESDFNASSVGELNIDYRGKTDESGSYLSLYVDVFK